MEFWRFPFCLLCAPLLPSLPYCWWSSLVLMLIFRIKETFWFLFLLFIFNKLRAICNNASETFLFNLFVGMDAWLGMDVSSWINLWGGSLFEIHPLFLLVVTKQNIPTTRTSLLWEISVPLLRFPPAVCFYPLYDINNNKHVNYPL